MVASKTTYRDPKTGRLIKDIDEHEKRLKQDQLLSLRREAVQNETLGIAKIGRQGGLVQAAEEEKKLADLMNMKHLPFNIAREDESRNAALASIQRWDDPMRYFATDEFASSPTRVKSEDGLTNPSITLETENELFFSQPDTAKRAPHFSNIYKRRGPSNRFNIPPGPQWDGVGNAKFLFLDRSNGFEAKYLSAVSSKSALEERAYRWASEDM